MAIIEPATLKMIPVEKGNTLETEIIAEVANLAALALQMQTHARDSIRHHHLAAQEADSEEAQASNHPLTNPRTHAAFLLCERP